MSAHSFLWYSKTMPEKSEQIINAAIDLFSKEGLGVNTGKISAKAGVSVGTLFNYFKTKQDLIDGVFLSIQKDFADALLGDVPETMPAYDLLQHIWNTYIHWSIKNSQKYETIQVLESSKTLSDSAKETKSRMFSYVRKNFEVSIRKKEILDTSIELLYSVIGGQLKGVTEFAMREKLKGKKLQELIDTGFLVNWRGIEHK